MDEKKRSQAEAAGRYIGLVPQKPNEGSPSERFGKGPKLN
jgi:hypothetical protein